MRCTGCEAVDRARQGRCGVELGLDNLGTWSEGCFGQNAWKFCGSFRKNRKPGEGEVDGEKYAARAIPGRLLSSNARLF